MMHLYILIIKYIIIVVLIYLLDEYQNKTYIVGRLGSKKNAQVYNFIITGKQILKIFKII